MKTRTSFIASFRGLGGSNFKEPGFVFVMQGLAKILELLPIVRKRFRKLGGWLSKPAGMKGTVPMKTTKAVELNAVILKTVVQNMPKRKLYVPHLEVEARADYRNPMKIPLNNLNKIPTEHQPFLQGAL